MDARTYIDTRVVGYELNRKRQQAVEARHGAEARTGTTWRTRRTPRLSRSPYARYVVGALIAALLVASFMGHLLMQQRHDAVQMWRVPQKRLVVEHVHASGDRQEMTFHHVTPKRAAV